MKKALTILVLLIFVGITNTALAQRDSDLKYRKFRVTLVPGLSTNGLEAPHYSAKYSLNILAGYHGGLEGYEIGLVNINRLYADGLQLGILNATGGDMAGLNFGGLVNYARGDIQGLQFSGIGNISGGGVQGLQFAGLVNAGGKGIQGMQFAGLANIAGGDIQGMQFAGVANAGRGDVQGILMSGVGNISGASAQGILMAGVLNVGKELQGISMAGALNVAEDMQGIQMSGLLNIADKGQGVQIGLINLASEFEGVPIGLISLYGNGRKNVDVWMSDGGYTNVGLKLGTTDVYNMISLAYNSFLNDDYIWSVGWTIGLYKPLDEAWNNDRFDGYFRMKDFSIRTLKDGGHSFWETSMYSFRYLLGKDITDRFGVYAGPSLNLLISDKEDEKDYTWYSIFDRDSGDHNVKFWLGFSVGLQFFGH